MAGCQIVASRESQLPAPQRQLGPLLLERQRPHTRRLAIASALPALGSSSREDQNPAQPPLSAWQKEKLWQASKLGRRSVPINTLSKELGLERQQVLQWLKQPEPLYTNRYAALQPS